MDRYLEKLARYPAFLGAKPAPDLEMIVVIPARMERHLVSSVGSLLDADPPNGSVEVLIILNDSETDPEHFRHFHEAQKMELRNWFRTRATKRIQVHVIHITMPQKQAGVGLARKAGMDEAVRRFDQLDRPEGMIIGFDGDSRCQRNYFRAISSWFGKRTDARAASIHFEHPLSGDDHSSEIYTAITEYELHLRYYIDMQRKLRLPWAYHTIGSAFAVRAGAYCEEGGMNRRQAGEDFYFLHKFTGDNRYGEILDTTVFPSPRRSDRVPFGTGKAVIDRLESGHVLKTYNPNSFHLIELLLSAIDWGTGTYDNKINALPEGMVAMLDLSPQMEMIRRHTASAEAFKNRFFQWFNAFKLMKLLHWLEENDYPRIPLNEVMTSIHPDKKGDSLQDLLQYYRIKQQTSEY